MRRWFLGILAAAALLFLTAASCAAPTNDRTGPNGAQPDGYQDAQHVVVYRNADTVPNVAVFCLGAYGWASTLKADSGGAGSGSPSLVRFPEYDKVCSS